jgi:hypothetical protein
LKPALLLTLLAATATAHARIGETVEQLDARYGKPTRTTAGPTGAARFEKRTYKNEGLTIEVFVYVGRSHQEIYKMPEGELSPEQVQKILEDNSFGSKWERTSFEVENSTYTLAKRLNAYHDHIKGALLIKTSDYDSVSNNFDRIQRQEREEDAKPGGEKK